MGERHDRRFASTTGGGPGVDQPVLEDVQQRIRVCSLEKWTEKQ